MCGRFAVVWDDAWVGRLSVDVQIEPESSPRYN